MGGFNAVQPTQRVISVIICAILVLSAHRLAVATEGGSAETCGAQQDLSHEVEVPQLTHGSRPAYQQARTAAIRLAGIVLMRNGSREAVRTALESLADWVDLAVLVPKGGQGDSSVSQWLHQIGKSLPVQVLSHNITWSASLSTAWNDALREALAAGADWAVLVADTQVARLQASVKDLKELLAASEEAVLHCFDEHKAPFSKPRFIKLPAPGMFVGSANELFLSHSQQAPGSKQLLAAVSFTEQPGMDLMVLKEQEKQLLLDWLQPSPVFSRWYCYLGSVYQKLHDTSTAIAAWQQCAKLSNNAQEASHAMFAISSLYDGLDKKEQAVQELKKAMQKYPGLPEVQYLMAFYAFYAGNPADAVAWSKMAVAVGCYNGTCDGLATTTSEYDLLSWFEGPFDVLQCAHRAVGNEAAAKQASEDYEAAKKVREERIRQPVTSVYQLPYAALSQEDLAQLTEARSKQQLPSAVVRARDPSKARPGASPPGTHFIMKEGGELEPCDAQAFIPRAWTAYSPMADRGGPGYALPGTTQVLQTVWDHQHPKDCSTAKFFIFKDPRFLGLGALIDFVADNLATAMEDNRVMLMDFESVWTDGSDDSYCLGGALPFDECYFEPMSSCSLIDVYGAEFVQQWAQEKNPVALEHMRRKLHGERFQFTAVTNVYIHHVIPHQVQSLQYLDSILHGVKRGGVQAELYWWRAMGTAYFARPNLRTLQVINQLKGKYFAGQFIAPGDVSVHVRHGNKHVEMPLLEDAVYVNVTAFLQQQHPQHASGYVFLSTEDPSTVSHFRGRLGAKLKYTTVPRDNHNGKAPWAKNPTEEALMALMNLDLALECDAWVGTLASLWSVLMDRLRATVRCKAGKPYMDAHGTLEGLYSV